MKVGWEREARSALAKCLDVSEIDNESLCHGTLGNLDALTHASEAFPSEQCWADEVPPPSVKTRRRNRSPGAVDALDQTTSLYLAL